MHSTCVAHDINCVVEFIGLEFPSVNKLIKLGKNFHQGSV